MRTFPGQNLARVSTFATSRCSALTARWNRKVCAGLFAVYPQLYKCKTLQLCELHFPFCKGCCALSLLLEGNSATWKYKVLLQDSGEYVYNYLRSNEWTGLSPNSPCVHTTHYLAACQSSGFGSFPKHRPSCYQAGPGRQDLHSAILCLLPVFATMLFSHYQKWTKEHSRESKWHVPRVAGLHRQLEFGLPFHVVTAVIQLHRSGDGDVYSWVRLQLA